MNITVYLLHTILQIFHITALTLLQLLLFVRHSFIFEHSHTGEIARAKKRRRDAHWRIMQERAIPLNTKIPRPQPRDLFCLELFAVFANLVADGARSFASGLAGSRALAAAAGAQGLFQHSFINSS